MFRSNILLITKFTVTEFHRLAESKFVNLQIKYIKKKIKIVEYLLKN